MPYHWQGFTPPRPQIAAAPVEDFVTAAHKQSKACSLASASETVWLDPSPISRRRPDSRKRNTHDFAPAALTWR